MIRVNAILIKLKYLYLSDNALFEKAIAAVRPSKLICPVCGATGQCQFLTSYNRMLISVSPEGKRTEQEVAVPRIRCASCSSTHALLPDVAIPNGSYSLRFILTVLDGYLKRRCTVQCFCDYWQISVSTLYGWIHLFIEQYSAWCRVMDRIVRITRQALEAVSSEPQFPGRFFSRFSRSFLQGQPLTTRFAPVAPGG